MKTITISRDDFHLIKSFCSEFKRAQGIQKNDYVIDWNGLMPVVEKIAIDHKMDFSIKAYIGRSGSQRFESLIDDQLAYTISFVEQKEQGDLISVTYKSVVEFIKWYNQQK